MAAIDNFDDVGRLSDDELRTLLEEGRPEQRVWAIWALALRSADAGELGRRDEPDAGVRRNLAVVLAGHGQLELLVALARRDPAPEVRAAATQLIARFAIDGKLSPSLVVERAADAAPVRMAVLGTAFAGAPSWLAEIAVQLLEDGDPDVRYEAFEALVRIGDHGRALMWLEEAPESEARLVLMRWTARGRVHACAELLARASRRLRRLLIESVRVADWQSLEPAIGDEVTLVRALARRDPNVFEQMPTAALIRATLRAPDDAWLAMVRDRLAHLDIPDPQLDIVLHDLRELCVRQIGEADTALHELRRNGRNVEFEIAALEDRRIVLENTLEHASRLLVH